ncbi:MAG: hypothetical protein ACE5HA_13000 [Anaerolineae bacterium]
MKMVVQCSAGGVVVRRRDEQLEIALILVGSQEEKRWQLSKGWLEKGEDSATAAGRQWNLARTRWLAKPPYGKN